MIDPARYGTLEHPGDGFSFDIYTQVARGARRRGPERVAAEAVDRGGRVAVGVRACRTSTACNRSPHAFDGFFVHSRGAVGLPLVAPGKYADIAGAISGTPTIFRTDQDAPCSTSRPRPTSRASSTRTRRASPTATHFRLWEVVGTAHADAHLVGPSAKTINCGVPINNGPMHIVAKAALRALTTWLTTGKAPVTAPRIDVTPGATPKVRRNADGIALGGIRTPPVDVPVAALSGVPGPNPSTICLLLGSTKPFSAARLAQLYPSRRVPPALRRRRRRDDQSRLRAPRRSRRPARIRATGARRELTGPTTKRRA